MTIPHDIKSFRNNRKFPKITFLSSSEHSFPKWKQKKSGKHCLAKENRFLNFLPVIFFNCVITSICISGDHFQTGCSAGVKKCHQCSGCWYSITEMIIKSSPSTEYVARCPSALQLQFTTLCCRNNCLLKICSCKKGTRSMKPAEEEEVEPSEAVSHLFSLMIIMCMSSSISPGEWIEENAKDRDILPAVMSCLIF